MGKLKSNISLEKVKKVFTGYVAEGWDTKGKLIARMVGTDNKVYDRVEQYGFNGMRMLDVGCATGRLFQFVEKKYKNCFLSGIDVSNDMLDIAKIKRWGNQNEIEFILDAFMEHNFGDSRFNIIVMKFVLHHMSDESAAVRKAVNLLFPGGHLIVYIPGSRHFKEIYEIADGDDNRLGRKNVEQLRKVMFQGGADNPEIESCEFRMQYKSYEDLIEFFRRTGMYQKLLSYETDKWNESLNEEIRSCFDKYMWFTGEYILADYTKTR